MNTPTSTRRQEPRRIVVGVDGSEPSKAALRWAARLAPAVGATIEAIIAWDYPANYGWLGVPGDWEPEADATKVLQTTLDETFGAQRPAGLEPLLRRGHPRVVLLEASEGAELLVVGSRGHGGFAGMLLGSVSAACAEHATCAVLVVHGQPS